MEIESLIDKLIIKPTESLEEAYNRSIDFFESEGFNIYRPDYLNDNILAKDISKIFNIFQENKTKLSFFVITEPWNNDNTNKILNSFSQTSESSKVYFISAYPLPDILAFIGKNSPASFFELEAIRNLKNISNITDNLSVENYSDILNNLSQKYFSQEITKEPAQGLKSLEKVIIKYFRNNQDYDQILDTDIEYFPYYSLLLASLYLSDLLIKNFGGEIFYDSQKDIKELGIGFSTNKDDMIDIMAHPVNKVFSFFINGKDSSVINWYYELKYYFTSKKA